MHEDKRGYGEGGGAESMLRDVTRGLEARGHVVRWYQGDGPLPAVMDEFQPDVAQVMTIHNFLGFGPVRWLQQHAFPHVWALMDYWPFCGGRMLLAEYDRGCAAVEGVCDEQCKDGRAPAYYLELVNRSPVIALNEYTADIYRRNGLRCDYVVTLGVDHEYFTPAPEKREAGRIATMSAWPQWPTKGMHILKAALKATGYKGNLITGLPRDRVRAELQRADVFVFPSCYQETWGLCLNEALSCGLACIASSVAGPRAQIEHGVNGLLVPPRDPDALADALRQVMTDDALRERLHQGARESVEQRMTLDHMAAQLEAVYRSVTNGT